MLTELIQAAATVQHSPMEAIVGAAIVVTQIGTIVLSHLKGKRGGVSMDGKLLKLGNDLRTAIDLRADSLEGEVGKLAGEVTRISSYVIGPDGQNGLRGDVRELRTQVSGLLAREPSQRRKR